MIRTGKGFDTLAGFRLPKTLRRWRGAMNLRQFRGFFYRNNFVWGKGAYEKRLAGFERRWHLETDGFTKAGFFEIFRKHFLWNDESGLLIELAVGDGLVGSLGVWLEQQASGWKVEAWEHRPFALVHLQKNRGGTVIRRGRLLEWSSQARDMKPVAVTARGAREASGICRAIRRQLIHPRWVGIWNPGRRPVWCRRMRACGYRLELVYERMQFYRWRKK